MLFAICMSLGGDTELVNDGFHMPAIDLGALERRAKNEPSTEATEELRKWLRMPIEKLQDAAELGHGASQHLLGNRYSAGDGVPKDPLMAIEWYTRAAEQATRARAHGP